MKTEEFNYPLSADAISFLHFVMNERYTQNKLDRYFKYGNWKEGQKESLTKEIEEFKSFLQKRAVETSLANVNWTEI